MVTETQAQYDRDESYLSLIWMSIPSALLIASLPFWLFQNTNCNEMACLVPLFMTLAVQWLAVVPVALIVVFLHTLKSRHDNCRPIHLVIRMGIPLAINVYAACSIFFLTFLFPALFVIIPLSILGIILFIFKNIEGVIISLQNKPVRFNKTEIKRNAFIAEVVRFFGDQPRL